MQSARSEVKAFNQKRNSLAADFKTMECVSKGGPVDTVLSVRNGFLSKITKNRIKLN